MSKPKTPTGRTPREPLMRQMPGRHYPNLKPEMSVDWSDIDFAEMERRVLGGLKMTDNVSPIMGIDIARGDDWGAIAIRKGTAVVLAAAAGAPAQINREWINGLYAGRRAEREVLAMVFETIAKAHGATVERRTGERNPGFHSGSIGLRIALNGVGASVDFSNLHGGGCALIHWFNTEYPPRDLTQHFAFAVRAGGNRSSHKATSFCPDWYGLAMALDAGLRLAAAGEAFNAEMG